MTEESGAFEELIKGLGEDFGKDAANDFAGLDSVVNWVPPKITTLTHYTGPMFKLTHRDTPTYGPDGGLAMVDFMGNVVVVQAKRRNPQNGEYMSDEDLGLAICVNGSAAFMPWRVVREMINRASAALTGGPEDKELSWRI